MTNITKKVEVVANCSIVLVAILLAVVLVKGYFIAPKQVNTISPGAKIPIANVDWSAQGETLVLALQKGCHFCAESAPFYRRLAGEAAQHGKVRLLAVLPGELTESKAYLESLGVPVTEMRRVPLSAIPVRGTPTLILVDHNGVVKRVWIGQLPPEQQAEVLAAVLT
jgi:hypothetical protein